MDKQNEELEKVDLDFENVFSSARKEGIYIDYNHYIDGVGAAGIYITNDNNVFFSINSLICSEDQEEICFILLTRHVSHPNIDYVLSLEDLNKRNNERDVLSLAHQIRLFETVSKAMLRLFGKKKRLRN
ncbi:hypothetical protein EHS13_20160 [Paenibacillus psychroresistens]|uniref:Uncharacterized protein n=1 Tax=Paenibacillus psychroresistens TaxID=1778678 RepID=A0A6B8RNB9_9BACL|nr:hypothetical protein [Paenibacillus psychroresistens]QGQ97033.1 hypothetical protein EHS13_20160 [Paenibacillus psychroresistens]